MRRRLDGRRLPGALAALLVTLILLAPARPALAHAVDLFGYVSVDEQGTVTARLVDVYGGLVEGQRVELYARPQGGRAGPPVVMEELEPGTYRGRAVPNRAGPYEVVIDLPLAGDLHRITLPVEPGVPVAERYVIMEQIEPLLTWTRVLFAAAAVVLAVGSVIAWRRRPGGPEPEAAEGGVRE